GTVSSRSPARRRDRFRPQRECVAGDLSSRAPHDAALGVGLRADVVGARRCRRAFAFGGEPASTDIARCRTGPRAGGRQPSSLSGRPRTAGGAEGVSRGVLGRASRGPQDGRGVRPPQPAHDQTEHGVKLVERTVYIEAPTDVVFELLTEAEHLVRWMAPSAEVDARPGGTIRWTHANGDTCSGEFIELIHGRRVVFTYGWERPDVGVPPGSTTVEITL